MLEAKYRISQLEDRKSDLEKKWDSQVSQVVSFFQELYSKLETRQTALLEQLSQMYHALMTPLQEAIQQLEQTVSYTGYVGVLSRHSQVAGIGDRVGDRIMDISMFVANYTLPTDPYMVKVVEEKKQNIEKFIDSYLNLSQKSIPAAEPVQISFLPKRNISFQLGQNFTYLIKPSDIAFDPTTNIFYALFDSYWKTYHQLPKSLKEIQIIKITNPVSFPINSSIALLNNSVIIMANNILFVYSEKGEVIKQIQIQRQIGLSFDNPKIYTFTGINSIYIASIESPHICKVNSQNGAKEGGINLTTQAQQLPTRNYQVQQLPNSIGCANFADMVRSTTQPNQLLILYTTYPTNNPPQSNTTNNQYCIKTCDINSMQCTGVYSLSQQMSPFCCITALSDTLYILDICTGSVHSYLFSQMTANNLTNVNYGGFVQVYYDYNSYSWKQQSHVNLFPKCTDVEGKRLKDTLIRAFYHENKRKAIFLSSGELHFIT